MRLNREFAPRAHHWLPAIGGHFHLSRRETCSILIVRVKPIYFYFMHNGEANCFVSGCQCPLVGRAMPEVELDVFHNAEIGKLHLSSFLGKWVVLFFYPADFTFVCPTELEELAAHYDEFQKLNAEVVSVSADTAFTHKAWHDSSPALQKVRYPMAADHNGKLARMLGIYIEEEGLSLRGTFIINPEGVVKSVEVHDNSIGRSAKETLRKLRAAQYVASHAGQVCPASWEPGDATLTPGVDLVGKI